MLTFTSTGKDADGTFNGRFVFRASPSSSPVPMETLADLFEGKNESFSDSIILHEYLHFVCFRESQFGIQTIGRRFHARRKFIRGQLTAVVDYYKQRTAYFLFAFRIHEGVVRRLEAKMRKASIEDPRTLRLEGKLRNLVHRADARARAACAKLHCKRGIWETVLDTTLGYLATREFGLQAHVIGPEGTRRLREISLSSKTAGIINAAFETELSKPNPLLAWLKRIRRSLNTEGGASGMSIDLMARWAAIKFHTEFSTIRDISRLQGSRCLPGLDPDFYIQTYASRTARFALRHTLFPADPMSVGTLAATILSCDRNCGLAEVNNELIANFSRIDEEVLYYFYVHGN